MRSSFALQLLLLPLALGFHGSDHSEIARSLKERAAEEFGLQERGFETYEPIDVLELINNPKPKLAKRGTCASNKKKASSSKPATTSKAVKTTSKAAKTTSKAAKTTSKAAKTTSKAAKTTSKAAKTTSKAAKTTSKAAKTTSKAAATTKSVTTKKAVAKPKTTTTLKPTTTSAKPKITTTAKPASTPKVNLGVPKSGGGLYGFTSPNCGASGADDEHPNGSISWLNCGISKSQPNSGWTPPENVDIHKLKTVTIEHALANNKVWEPCKPYISRFEKYGAKYDLPPIMLAAIALQESTCREGVLGDNGGAFGLMQITKDKCGGRDTAGCTDPDYNIETGAAYLAAEIKRANGNFLTALGQYNGWTPGMSFKSATAAANSGCCVCQNNLDYLDQMLNGWILGKTGYTMKEYDNLAVCGKHW